MAGILIERLHVTFVETLDLIGFFRQRLHVSILEHGGHQFLLCHLAIVLDDETMEATSHCLGEFRIDCFGPVLGGSLRGVCMSRSGTGCVERCRL